MPEPAAAAPARPPRRSAFRIARGLLVGGATRLYALILIAIVLYLSWRAFKYLILALLLPAPPPPQIVDIPRRMVEQLRQPGPGFAGVTAVEHPRTPVGHYHRVEPWFQPDPANTCTRSGCHTPLPHGRNKADRAFLNMHATSLHCGVCHLQSDRVPLPLTWYDLDDGAPAGPPALLKAYGRVLALRARPALQATAAEQDELVQLVQAAARAARDDTALAHLAAHLAAVRPESGEFANLVETAATTLPRHFRGEYGAKLAVLDPIAGRPRLEHPDSAAAVREYLARGAQLDPAARDALLARVHTARRPQTLTCSACHTPHDALVDLAAVGYPPERIAQLVQPLITRAIEHIMQGQEFRMPTLLTPDEPGGG